MTIKPAATKPIAALALGLLLAACGTQFMYNRLDWIIPWYVDGYVSLERSQEQLLEDRLRPLLGWHRREELARYLQFLQRVEADINSEVTARTVQLWRDEARGAWRRVKARALPPLLELGGTLSDAQMAEFIEGMREKHLELAEEHLGRDGQDYREETRDNFRDNFEDYLGALSDAQLARIDAAVADMRRIDHLWIERRARRMEALAVILQKREPGWEAQVQTTLAAFERAADEEKDTLRNREVIRHAIADVLNLRSQAQSLHLAGEIASLKADIQGLISQSQPEPPPQG